jgi:TolB-like protein/DNA-binding winged helix-turn-helix (wHTH) protein/Tfp pilus assembly protein PilF
MQHKIFAFGEFTLDVARGALLKNGVEARLRPQSFEVLRFLVENANRLVSKDEIFRAVWHDTVVTDDSLTQCLIDIRRAIDDEMREMIRTVPRRGYVFEFPVSESGVAAAAEPPPPARSANQRAWLVAAAGVAMLAVVAWLGLGRYMTDTPATDRAAAPANSIAVLAFVDMSEGGDHEYFADGVSEEILNLLTRIPELRVVARTSSFSFKGKDVDIATIAEALDVAFVLEGSVRRAGDQVRVTAQLVDAATSTHVWSETYDRDLDDLLAVQTDIAESVARSLKITFAESTLSGAPRVVNPEAYERYLHGRFLHNRRAPGDTAAAEAHFREAVRIDPGYASAWAALAGVHLVRSFEGDLPAEQQLERMGEAITRALALDPLNAEVQLRAAQYYWHKGDIDRGQPHWERAQALGPNNVLVLGSLAGNDVGHGRLREAVAKWRRAVEADPLGYVTRANFARSLILVGEYEEATLELRRARELNPAAAGLDLEFGQLLFLRGRFEEALAAYESLPEGPDREQGLALVYRSLNRADDAEAMLERLRNRENGERALRLAEIHAQRGDPDEAFVWLEIARELELAESATSAEPRFADSITESFLLGPLYGDPRWVKYLRQDPV